MIEQSPPDTDAASNASDVSNASDLSGASQTSSSASRRPKIVMRPCVHCGEATPSNDSQQANKIFCCNGCRGAYELIHGWGLDDFYGLRDQLAGGAAHAVREHSLRYEAFDRDEFLGASSPRETTDGLLVCDLAVHGLHCGACAWLIENAAMRTAGWSAARVKMSDHTLKVTFDPAQTSLSRIAGLLDRLGYEIAPLPDQRDDHFRQENRRLLIQIAVAGFFAANAMWIAVALYAGEASGLAENHRELFRIIGTALGISSVVFPGRTFFRGAIASLRTRTPHMDIPVALGLSVGTVVGGINALTARGDLYFDSLAVLVFLLLIGRWIQFHQQHAAAKAVDLLLRITPRHANRVAQDGSTELVLVDRLSLGEMVRVAVGESVPVDGITRVGESCLDRSLLTGESEPVEVVPGDEVTAGTVNLHRVIDVEVTAIGNESRIGKVMHQVEEAISRKTPVVHLADRIGGVFVIAVSLLAIATLFAWSTEGWGVATSNATSLLIVACPCALALATPLAIAVSIGRAAKHQALIRDGASLQLLSRPGKIWFDKTGTLTQGRPDCRFVWGDVDAVSIAASIEQHSKHPIARAVVRLSSSFVGNASGHEGTLRESTSQGVYGTYRPSRGNQSVEVYVGNRDWIESHGILIPEEAQFAVSEILEQATSPLFIAIDSKLVAVLAISDPLKPNAAEMVTRLQDQGWQVGILSGDHPRIVRQIANQVGVASDKVFGGVSPEEKLHAVRSGVDQANGSVVMIGDGANDAASLAAADVGIAVRGGAEVSLQAAPIYLASDDLGGIYDLISSARRTDGLIRTSFAVSLSYNVIAVGLAMAGKISPLMAAVLMPISSVSVLALTLAWPTYQVTARSNSNST